eukprot:COSAG01_NODE_3844_length_5645_cov_8.301479_4_plen_67_part_00
MMVQLYVNETSTQLHVLDILRWDFLEDLLLLVVTVGWRVAKHALVPGSSCFVPRFSCVNYGSMIWW